MISKIIECWPLLAFFGISAWYTITCPFNKVEESFNTQAIHDLIYHWPDLEKFDHFQFPGVVPRTFLGAILVAIPSKIAQSTLEAFDRPVSKLSMMIISRLILGFISAFCWFKLQNSVAARFGKSCGVIFSLLTISQFHQLFYATRTLPNTFAVATVTLAYAAWFKGSEKKAVAWLTLCATVFRFESSILLASVLLAEAVASIGKTSGMIKACFVTFLISVTLTITVDSVLWDKPVWPEASVFYFNIIMNKSSEWGTQPWTWYVYKALPNSLLLAYPFALLGFLRSKVSKKFFFPSLTFLMLFSCLPHKELRFIFFVIPVLNLAAASCIEKLYSEIDPKRRMSRFVSKLLFSFIILACLGSSIFRAILSSKNYPGGTAMISARELLAEPKVSLHIDTFSAMNGVSRFLELNDHWSYDKKENLLESDLKVYTHLLTMIPVEGFKILRTVKGFSGLRLKIPRNVAELSEFFPFIKIVQEDKIFIMENSDMQLAADFHLRKERDHMHNPIGSHEEL